MSTSGQTAIKAAMSIAGDIAEGRLLPSQLAAAALDECRAWFGAVGGPLDALWPLQVDVGRQVMALGGYSANELAEWAAVARQRERGGEAAAERELAYKAPPDGGLGGALVPQWPPRDDDTAADDEPHTV